MENDKQNNIEKYDSNPLSNNVFFDVTKKTEKIVTAVYMVTSFIEETDPLQIQIRQSAVTLLGDIFTCLEASSVHKTSTLSQSIINIEHLISLFEIAQKMGFVSEMNARILHKELMQLQTVIHQELHRHGALDAHRAPHTNIDQHSFLSDLLADPLEYKPEIKNDINDNNMSFKQDVVYKKRQTQVARGNASERQQKIIEIIKDKKSVTMKDIATRITNCTEKTLQRDLNSLIKKGRIEKQGAKRWSKYILVD